MHGNLSEVLRWTVVLALLALPRLASATEITPDKIDPHEIKLRLVLPWDTAPGEARRLGGLETSVMAMIAVPETILSSREASSVPSGFLPLPQIRPTKSNQLGWLGIGAVLLIPSDSTTLKWFDPDIHETPAGDDWGRQISKLGTDVPMAAAILAPALLDGRYGRKTTQMTAMAVLNATLLTQSLKLVTGRERPHQSGGVLRLHGPGSGYESFPSGHASAAFAAATVLGHQYPKYKLVFYGLAGAVAVGRINAARHFPSDVLVGVSIGIYHGRLVLRHGGKLRLWH